MTTTEISRATVGIEVAHRVDEDLSAEVVRRGLHPRLALLVGGPMPDPTSDAGRRITAIKEHAHEAGTNISPEICRKEAILAERVLAHSQDPDTHGIIVIAADEQLAGHLPDVTSLIDPRKDVAAQNPGSIFPDPVQEAGHKWADGLACLERTMNSHGLQPTFAFDTTAPSEQDVQQLALPTIMSRVIINAVRQAALVA